MGIGSLIDTGNFGDDYQPVRGDATDIFDVTGAAIQNAIDNFQTFSASNLKDDALYEQQEQIESITGRDLYDVIGQDARNNDIERFKRVDELIRNNQEMFSGVRNSDQVLERAQEKARMSARQLQLVSENASGFSSVTGNLVGGFAGGAVDPVNLATLPIGAGAGSTVLKAVLIEAGLNAGIEVATQPNIAAWQRQIGNEYGLDDAVMNVGFAAVLGGGFAGVTRGMKPTASAAFEYISKFGDNLPQSARNSIKQLADWAHIKENSPFESLDLAQVNRHLDNITQTSRAFELRRSLDDAVIDTLGMRKNFLADQAGSLATSPLVPSRSSSVIPALFSSSSLNTSPLRAGRNIASVGETSGALTQSLASSSQRTASKSLPSNSFDTATISPLRNPASVSIGRIADTSNYIVYQPSKDVNKIIDLANKNKSELETFLKDSVKGVKGAEFYGVRVKEAKSLTDKLTGKGRDVDGIADVLGGRVVVDSYTAMEQVIDYLKARATSIEVENKIPKKGKGIYRAVHVVATSRDGVAAEIQIQPRQIRQVQDEAHDIYKRWQHEKPEKLTKKELDARKKDLKKSQKLFDDAWKKWNKTNKGQKPFDEASRITPLVDDLTPRMTPADVDSDVGASVLRDTKSFESSIAPEVFDDVEVQRIRAAEEQDLQRLADDDPNFVVELDDADLRELFPGRDTITAKDIIELREADERLVEAMNFCAIG